MLHRTTMLRFLACCTMLVALASEEGRGLKPLTVTADDGTAVVRFTSHHALVIGNSRYQAGWQQLPGVIEDVQAVRIALEGQGFAVDVAMDLTRSQLDERLSAFVAERGQDANGRVVFYYAGHGQTLRNNQGQENGYLVPIDAPVPTEGNRSAFIAKAYPIQRIKIAAQELGCRHALFLFDACFSGALFAPLRGGNAAILQMAAEPVRMFITSGSSDEQVPDQSIFREEFVTALNDGVADVNHDGWTTGSELSLYLRQQVMGRRAAAGGRQTPQAGISEQAGLNRGDVVFRAKPGRVAIADPPVDRTSAVAALPTPGSDGSPAWASAHGSDASGPWAEITIDGVVQRLRLVPAGQSVAALWVSDSECTQGFWRAVTGTNPSYWTGITAHDQRLGDTPDEAALRLPVESVSWDDVQAFLEKLDARVAGLHARLPTEAEWQWASSLGQPYPGQLEAVAWLRTFGIRTINPVKTKQGNAAGLHDMLGNVWEWCADPWQDHAGSDPALERLLRLGRTREQAAGNGERRTLRGGGFLDKATVINADLRLGEKTSYSSRDLGFRFVVTP
jgi:hypothetical protein